MFHGDWAQENGKNIPMNLPAANHGVSMFDKFYPNAASCGELNPADFAISIAHS